MMPTHPQPPIPDSSLLHFVLESNFLKMINKEFYLKMAFAVIAAGTLNNQVYSAEARAYYTSGVGSLEKCKSVGIQICNSENIPIPKYIMTDIPPWWSIYHRLRKDGTSMCWLKIKEGGLTKETLSFICTPVH